MNEDLEALNAEHVDEMEARALAVIAASADAMRETAVYTDLSRSNRAVLDLEVTRIRSDARLRFDALRVRFGLVELH